MQANPSQSMAERICAARIIAVVVFEAESEVAPTVEALLEGGVTAIELALRSPYAIRAVELVRSRYADMLLGVGTILTPQQVQQIKDTADFGVAPGTNRRVLEAAEAAKLPFFPGVSTASEVETALEYDARLLKFFPAEPLGGLDYLKSMHAPYAHLGLRYVPLGGIGAGNLPAYLQSPIIGAVGGSWIASRKLIEAKDWGQIRTRAAEATKMASRNREAE